MSRIHGSEPGGLPRVSALTFCDRVLGEAGGKKSLIDIFWEIKTPELPAIMRVGFYVCVERGADELQELFFGLFSPRGEALIQVAHAIEDWGNGTFNFSFDGNL